MAVSFVYAVFVEFTVVKRGNITFGDEDIIVLISKVEEFLEKQQLNRIHGATGVLFYGK